jgi:hypothetical protein
MRASEPPSLRVLHAGADVVIGQVRETLVSIWRNQPLPRTFGWQRTELTRLVRKLPGQASFMCVIEDSCAPLDDPLRKETVQMLAGFGRNLRALAVVIEGSGFKASITRSVLVGIQLLSRLPVPVKFFRSAEEGAPWLHSDASMARDVSRAAHALRACFTAATRDSAEPRSMPPSGRRS